MSSAQAQLAQREQQINNPYVHPRDMIHNIGVNIDLDLWSSLTLNISAFYTCMIQQIRKYCPSFRIMK